MTTLTTSVLDIAPVIPVVTVEDPAHAVPLARALAAGGIGVIEVPLRTARALEAVAAIAAEVPEIALGVGTVLTPQDADAALAHGASFLVTPGCSPSLLRHVASLPVPVLPGVATVGEMLAAHEAGFTELKFFPAGPAGGPAYLAALAGPLPHLRFCPTGGISRATMGDYLALANVPTVGGSWLTPADAVAAQDWDRITALAAEAAGR